MSHGNPRLKTWDLIEDAVFLVLCVSKYIFIFLVGFKPTPEGLKSFTFCRLTKRLKNLPASLQVRGLEPTLKRKNRPNCQLVYKKNNFSWGDFSGGWQIFLGKSPTLCLVSSGHAARTYFCLSFVRDYAERRRFQCIANQLRWI